MNECESKLSSDATICYLFVWSVQLREEFVGSNLNYLVFFNLNSIRSAAGLADSDASHNAGQNS
jgi:hypothetical protein